MAKLYTEAELEETVSRAVREAVLLIPAVGDADSRLERAYAMAQTELALARSRAELGDLKLEVVRDALEQANEELVRQRNQAQDYARTKSRFFASIAHELRSPMGVVHGFADLLLQEQVGPVNERQRRYLHNIVASSDHLLALVSDMLDFSKIEAGKFELTLETVDLSCALGLVTNLLLFQANQKKLELELEVAPALPELVADEVRLRQIVFNLVGNAVKFTPEGGSVRVRALAAEAVSPMVAAKEALEVRVEDTGVGIAAEEAPLVFDEFHQAGDARTGKVKGTGLGLAISRRLARMHGGELWCESELGKGSNFILQIPWRPSAELLAQHGRPVREAA